MRCLTGGHPKKEYSRISGLSSTRLWVVSVANEKAADVSLVLCGVSFTSPSSKSGSQE